MQADIVSLTRFLFVTNEPVAFGHAARTFSSDFRRVAGLDGEIHLPPYEFVPKKSPAWRDFFSPMTPALLLERKSRLMEDANSPDCGA